VYRFVTLFSALAGSKILLNKRTCRLRVMLKLDGCLRPGRRERLLEEPEIAACIHGLPCRPSATLAN
jgi:hypothetical protein